MKCIFWRLFRPDFLSLETISTTGLPSDVSRLHQLMEANLVSKENVNNLRICCCRNVAQMSSLQESCLYCLGIRKMINSKQNDTRFNLSPAFTKKYLCKHFWPRNPMRVMNFYVRLTKLLERCLMKWSQ